MNIDCKRKKKTIMSFHFPDIVDLLFSLKTDIKNRISPESAHWH